jgi:hypothetical protein
MNAAAARFLRLGLALCGLVFLGWMLTAHAGNPSQRETSLTTDWSHRHLIFSRPGSAEQFARVAEEPRFWQQIRRREQALTLPTSMANADSGAIAPEIVKRYSPKLKRDWSEDLGSGADPGAGNYPAKYSFTGSTANCGTATSPDYVVYSTGLAGSGGQASVVAFDNLYSGCLGTVPSVYWAFNTGGQILTSPLISLSGSQVAFVETSGGHGILVMLKWAAGSGTLSSPVTPTLVGASSYSACTAPCMTQISLENASGVPTDDTTSSVFYDYTNDIGWVGGTGGWLHKITGMFNGVPTEVNNGVFPIEVNSGATLSSPVYDSGSGNVFVGDQDGFLYSVSVNIAIPVVTQSAELDFGVGIVEGPIVDSTDGLVYVFASSDGSTGCSGGTSACTGVYQLPTGFSSGDSGTEATVGTSVASTSTPNPLYIGAFDSSYYNSDATGNLYVCGNTGVDPILYQIPISSGVFPATGAGTVLVGLVSAAFSPACSPVADVPNPNTNGGFSERLFVSVQNHGVATGCGGTGCIMNFIDTPWLALTAYQLHQQILDIHLNIEEVTHAGTSGGSVPTFSATAGTPKTDGSVIWINQGALSATPLPLWAASTIEAKIGNRIVDRFGNIEVVTKTGTTGTSSTGPPWSTTVGGTTINDGTVNWINAGASLISALPATGGTSGIIIDDVLNGTVAGTSQVYFTTLNNELCATSGGTGGCAVQASQAGLK